MKAIVSTLVHTILPPDAPAGPRHPTLIMMHGRGADEENLLDLAPSLDPRFLVISVRAPFPFAYSGGYTWYNIQQLGTPDPMMFRQSHDRLCTFIRDALTQYPIDPQQLFLLGFSMGTVMSFALALSLPEAFRGIVAHSGYIAEDTHLAYKWNELSRVEFFVAHGMYDTIIPLSWAQRARDLLTVVHARLTYKEYPIAHSMSNESVGDAVAWLRQQLVPTG